MDERAVRILQFWFGLPPYEPRPQWFQKNAAFDEAIREQFARLIEIALSGGLRDWDADPRGRLARILLLDQFTRNIFRGSARAFAGDSLALAAAREAVASGVDLGLHPLERAFLYLPFEHAEDLAAQEESVRLFASLCTQDEKNKHFDEFYDYAVRHRNVIARFGRFPHRNASLNRPFTNEEKDYLVTGGDAF